VPVREIIESTFDRVKYGLTNLTWILYVVVVIDIEPIRERFFGSGPFSLMNGGPSSGSRRPRAFAAGYGRDHGGFAMATGVAPSHDRAGPEGIWRRTEPSERISLDRELGPQEERSPRIRHCSPDLKALVEPTTRGDPESPLAVDPARACAA